MPRLQDPPTGSDWTEKNAAGQVKSGPKVMLIFRSDSEKVSRAELTSWVSQASTEMDPVWQNYVWNTKDKIQERSEQHPMPTSGLLGYVVPKINSGSSSCSAALSQHKGIGRGVRGGVPVGGGALKWIGMRSNQAQLCYQEGGVFQGS